MRSGYLWLSTLCLPLAGCVLSLSPLPSSYGPPVWQPSLQGPMAPPITSTPVSPMPSLPPSQSQAPPVDSPPAALEVPDLRGASRGTAPRA
jgi:hypothetical protein